MVISDVHLNCRQKTRLAFKNYHAMNASKRLFATTALLLTFACNTVTAQETADVNNNFAYLADSNSSTSDRGAASYTGAIFGGEDNNVQSYFAEHLNFPETGISTGKSGSMKVWFEILPDGTVGDTRIEGSPGAEFDAAVKNCLDNMPRWTPAYLGTTAVKSTRAVKLNFRLR